MDIAQYHRNVRRTATAGNVIANPSNSWGELERMGNTLTQFGMASEKQRLEAQYHDQINKAKLEISRKFEKYQNKLDPNNTDKWLDDLDNTQKSYGEIELSNEKANADFAGILENEKFNQKKSITDYRRAVDAQNFQRNYYVNKKEFMEMASRAQTPGDYDKSVLDSLKHLYGFQLKEGAVKITPENLETVEDFTNPLFHTEELRKNEAEAWLKDSKELYDEVQIKNIYNQYSLMAQENPEAVMKLIADGNIPIELKNDPGYYKALKNNALNAKYTRDAINEQVGNDAYKEIHELAAKSIDPRTPEGQRPNTLEIQQKILDMDISWPQKTKLMANVNNALKTFQQTGEDLFGNRPTEKFAEIRQGILDGTIKKESQVYEWTGKTDGYGQSQESYLLRLLKGDESKAKAFEDTSAAKTLKDMIDGIPLVDEGGFEDKTPVTANTKSFALKMGYRMLEDEISNNSDMSAREKEEEAIRIFNRINRQVQAGEIEIKAENLPGAKVPLPEGHAKIGDDATFPGGMTYGTFVKNPEDEANPAVELNDVGIRWILGRAGGDVAKARQIAKEEGYIIPK